MKCPFEYDKNNKCGLMSWTFNDSTHHSICTNELILSCDKLKTNREETYKKVKVIIKMEK